MRRSTCWSVVGIFVGMFGMTYAGDGTRLQPLDVFGLQFASGPRVSPDGSRIVYVRNFMDRRRDRQRTHLWIIGADGGDHRSLVADDDRDASQPRWSPDGSKLAFVANPIGDADGTTSVYVRWMDSGQTFRLAELERGPDDLAWSPDGKSIAFTMLVPHDPEPFVELPKPPEGAEWAKPPIAIDRVRFRFDGQGYLEHGYRHVFVVSAEGGAPRQLTSGELDHHGPLAWTRDGDSLFCSANRGENRDLEPLESELYRITVADGTLTAITDRSGPDHTPVVSPEGKRLAWLGFDDRRRSMHQTQLYVADLDGGNRREVTTAFDREIERPVWDADGLAVQFDDRGTTKIGRVSLEGAVRVVAENVGGTTIGRPYASGDYSSNAAGRIAFTLSTPEHPGDVAVVDGDGTTRRLTELNADLFAAREIASTEELLLKSSVDEREIQAWLVKPPGFDPDKSYPLILEIHGGPFANYGSRFAYEMQLYAAAGYVVLYVNPRGSTSYGREFADEIHHAYPGHDYDDLMDAVDATLAKGYVDEKRLYVTGGSGGGVLTAWIVGKTNRFRAAVSAKPVINWYSFVLTADAYPFFANYWFPGPPWEHAEQYLKRSPLSLVGNVETPTMLLTGEEDFRTPMSESEQYYQALKLRKIDTMLVRVPGASHNIVGRPSHLIAKSAYVLGWFRRYGGE